MIHDQIRKTLNESMSAVMSCRAARSSIILWRKRLARITNPRQKLMARKMIIKKKLKVNKCKQRGLMI